MIPHKNPSRPPCFDAFPNQGIPTRTEANMDLATVNLLADVLMAKLISEHNFRSSKLMTITAERGRGQCLYM